MDIIVIGAGAAGLSAARRLHDAGQNVVILEATDRIGGRVHTDRTLCDIPIEFGAEFIHGSEVPTWEWVEKLGLSTLSWRKTDDSMIRLLDGAWLTMTQARQIDPDFNQTRTWDLPDEAVLDSDETWEGYLRRMGFTADQLRYVQRTFANAVGEPTETIGAAAMLERIHFRGDGSGDFRIVEGYDRFINALAADLDIRLHQPVTQIRWASGVEIETDEDTFSADYAIVAVPLGILQSNTIGFKPELPTEKQMSLRQLKMGAALKMIYVFDAPIIEDDIMAIYSNGLPPMWWSPSYGHHSDKSVWTAFATGDYARQLLALGEAAALERGFDTLRMELNRPDLQAVNMHLVDWVNAPYTRGGYSVGLAGGRYARSCLAAPTAPLFWAGEATAPNTQAATVHGAYLSGLRAAYEILSLNHIEHGTN
jgi:monoamine oxidase